MNYTSFLFWLLFAAVFAVYWRVGHRAQNRLILLASYLFYGAWDYRFLFLLLISTAVDYVGGLGVAGKRVPGGRLRNLSLLLIASSALLCSNIRYGSLLDGISAWNSERIIASLPRGIGDLWIPLATAAVCGIYGLVLPRLYDLPESA